MGKSYGVVKWADTTGNPLTILTSRHDLYGQYETWCAERGLSHLSLPAFHRDCATIDVESDEKSPIEEKIKRIYDAGITGSAIHQKAELYFGQPLPCQKSGPCPYMQKREFDPAEYDVLIGHYLQAHNSDYLEDRYVAFDEFPGDAYFFEPTHNEATRAITNYLEEDDTLPFDNWKQLDRGRYKDEYQDAIAKWKEDFNAHYPTDTRHKLQQKSGFHAHAPILTYAGLEFELLDNQWEYADMGGGHVAVKSPEDEWTVLMPPNLYPSKSIVALDGTPTLTKWRLILGGYWITHENVLDSAQEKRKYLRDVLGLTIVQTDAGAKPYQSGRHVNVDSDSALLEGIREREGRRPTVITSKKAKEIYETEGVDNHIERSEHYGNLKGMNDFSKIRLGAVIGSPHPPEDEAVERWAALNGKAAERKTNEEGQTKRGVDLDFGPHGNALFRDVVDYEVLQAVMRFGRTDEGDEKGATVYVHTSRLPSWVRPKSVEVRTWSKGMREVVAAIRQSEKWPDGEWKNAEIAEHTSIEPPQVRDLMKELADEGYVSYRRGGRGNAYHWSNECLDEFTEYGNVK